MVRFYKKRNKYNEIQLTINKMDLNIQRIKKTSPLHRNETTNAQMALGRWNAANPSYIYVSHCISKHHGISNSQLKASADDHICAQHKFTLWMK